MRKVTLFLSMICAICCMLFCADYQMVSAESSANCTLVMPDEASYVELKSPEIVAVCDDTVAIYDEAVKSVFIAGGTTAKIELTNIDKDDYVIQMTFCNDDLYILTSFSVLYCYSLASKTLTPVTDFKTASSIFSDKSVLYVYDGLRTVTAFNKADESTTVYEDETNKIMHTQQIAVIDTRVYCLKQNGEIFVFDAKQNSVSLFYRSNAQSLSTIDRDGEKLLIYSPDDGGYVELVSPDGESVVKASVGETFGNVSDLKYIASSKNQIAVLDVDSNAVIITDGYFCQSKKMYGSSGNRDGWFNSPSDVTAFGTADAQYLYVSDTGNRRVAELKLDENGAVDSAKYFNLPNGDEATAIAYGGYNLYVATKSALYLKPQMSESFIEMSVPFEIDSITASDDGVYALDDSTHTIYRAAHDRLNFSVFCSISHDAFKIKTSRTKGSPIYALSSDSLYVYTAVGKIAEPIALSDFSIKNPTDVNVDFVGNVYVSYDKSIAVFGRASDKFEFKNAYNYENDDILNAIGSFSFDPNADKCAFYAVDADKNTLILLNNSADLAPVLKSDFAAAGEKSDDDFKELQYDDVGFAVSVNCPLYRFSNNCNDIVSDIISGTKALVINPFATSELSYIVTENGRKGYVGKSKLTPIQPKTETAATIRALHENVHVYEFPSGTATSRTLKKSDAMKIISNACDFSNGDDWYAVEYNLDGTVRKGYVMRKRVIEFNPSSVSGKPIYAKIASSRLGAKVYVYSLADEKTNVVATLADGAKVELVEPFNPDDKFTMIKVGDDIFGYVYTADLDFKSGLTNGQIIAVVLASAMLSITAIYFLLSRRAKKK